MASLADELFAASANEERECQNVSNRPVQNVEHLENNPNIANTSTSSRADAPIKASSSLLGNLNEYELNGDQCSLPADTSYDMDITCDVTLPAMRNPQFVNNSGTTINSAISATDNLMDETIGDNVKDQGMMNDGTKLDLSTMKIEDEQPQNSLDINFDNSKNANVIELQRKEYEMSRQSTCLWSEISTNFDPDEETANFGTRYALEADGKLFDVFTYATIEPKVILNNSWHKFGRRACRNRRAGVGWGHFFLPEQLE